VLNTRLRALLLNKLQKARQKTKILAWIPEIFTYMCQGIPNIEHETNWTHNQTKNKNTSMDS
jgi:hypothetical protein